ncbi:unnamed protein product [Durusdinium trenchii]|uniref:Small RNA 2'-O-methyltransferase n=1 Tax=Durusdinium trenchii TaxID=1381693 RepID=A0ABP0ND62_9DINO
MLFDVFTYFLMFLNRAVCGPHGIHGQHAPRASKTACRSLRQARASRSYVPSRLEKQERLTAAVTGRILHPMLQDLLETLPMGEEVVLRTPCHYEQIACDLELRAQLLELQLPPEPEPPKKVIKFSPPLWKQRQAFIVQALLARCVKSVLDLGCGDGKLLEALLPLGFERLVGLELSEHRTKDARQRLAAAAHGAANGAAAWTVLSGDFVAPEDEGEQAPWILEAAGIEGIVLCEVLEHLPEPSMPRLSGKQGGGEADGHTNGHGNGGNALTF